MSFFEGLIAWEKRVDCEELQYCTHVQLSSGAISKGQHYLGDLTQNRSCIIVWVLMDMQFSIM
jgi:hypothetical protein